MVSVLIGVIAFFAGAAIEDFLWKDKAKIDASKSGKLVLLNSATGETRVFRKIRKGVAIDTPDESVDLFEVVDLKGEPESEDESDDAIVS